MVEFVPRLGKVNMREAEIERNSELYKTVAITP
jgi:hypothetical protein